MLLQDEILQRNRDEIKAIVLTPEEAAEAYYEGQKKRYFHEKNREYWARQAELAVEKHEEEKAQKRVRSSQPHIDQKGYTSPSV